MLTPVVPALYRTLCLNNLFRFTTFPLHVRYLFCFSQLGLPYYCLRLCFTFFFFFSSRRRHTRLVSDWSSDVCSSDLLASIAAAVLDSRFRSMEDFLLPNGKAEGSNFTLPGACSAGGSNENLADGLEIGRASCRERV